MEQKFKVRTRYANGLYQPLYGNSIGGCKAMFDSDKTYTAIAYSGLYQEGDQLVHDFVIDVFDDTLDGYDNQNGQSYSSLTEFNSEFAIIE